MASKNISREKIISAFLFCAFDKNVGGTSLQDIAAYLGIKKASLYNHFAGREEMYKATLEYCRDYCEKLTFIPENFMKLDLFQKKSLSEVFNTLIKRYIQIYETEPVFQIFTFVHSEKYFNSSAAEIAERELQKLEYGVSQILLIYCNDKKAGLSPIELAAAVKWYSSAIFCQIDNYIMKKKEIVRQNPECGVGSLFALPTDDEALEKIYFLSDQYLTALLK
ncbi:MAG: TetR/AcrR family transcriptional regulator [Treponema sp.]|nr:TetR/AcrR family transcriptional regulator [Treponema sp.]